MGVYCAQDVVYVFMFFFLPQTVLPPVHIHVDCNATPAAQIYLTGATKKKDQHAYMLATPPWPTINS